MCVRKRVAVLRWTREAFTLIELAIALVIIALIVGGVLVGTDLITASERRLAVRQVELFDSAANVFRNRYNCLPGDCLNATVFGWSALSSGNGDGTVGYPPGCDGLGVCIISARHEHINFWYHLHAAGLIPYAIAAVTAVPPSTPDMPGVATPPVEGMKLRYMGLAGSPASGGWIVHGNVMFESYPGRIPPPLTGHSFALGSIRAWPAASGTVFNGYAPADLHYIDNKIDDGFPVSGKVIAIRLALALEPPQHLTYNGGLIFGYTYGDTSTPVCVRTDTDPFVYNVLYTGTAQYGSCGVVIKASF